MDTLSIVVDVSVFAFDGEEGEERVDGCGGRGVGTGKEGMGRCGDETGGMWGTLGEIGQIV